MSTETTTDPRGTLEWGLCMLPRSATVGWGARFIVHENWQHREWERRREQYYAVREGLKRRGASTKHLKRPGREPARLVVDFVWDRQAFYGEAEDREAFKKLLNKGTDRTRPIVKAIKEIGRLFATHEWSMMSSRPRTLYSSPQVTITGDPRGSGGYVYVCAYPTPQVTVAPHPQVSQAPQAETQAETQAESEVQP